MKVQASRTLYCGISYSPITMPYILLMVRMLSDNSHLPHGQVNWCIGCWLLTCVCVILQEKISSKKSWIKYLEDEMKRFFQLFDTVRSFLLWIENKTKRYASALSWLIFIFGIVWMLFLLSGAKDHPEVLPAASILCVIAVVLAGACAALHSCRKLLRFWFIHGLLFSIGVSSVLPICARGEVRQIIAYGAFVVMFSLFWITIAGAADDDVGKMAACIVNTGTTILLIVINVLANWGIEADMWLWKEVLEILQYYSIVAMLPLVVAGYLAGLLKELQIYWKHHHPSGDDSGGEINAPSGGEPEV